MLRALYDEVSYYEERSMGDDRADAWAGRATEILALLGTPQAMILDFGAGDGGLVQALRGAGVGADGIEPSNAARGLARERGITLYPETPTAVDEPFTAVTMLHVLEHVADPVAELTQLRRVLQPEGRLLIEVPNVTSIDAYWPPLRPLILDLPFHLHHFTPRTLAAVVTRAGFEPMLVRRFNPMGLDWLLSRRRAGADPAPTQDPSRCEPLSREAPCPYRVALWHRTLPHLRRALPGAKLQLVARA